MKKVMTFLFPILIIAGCLPSKNYVSIEDKEYEVSRPPNMVKVDNNLFADVTEISNMDWKEYNYWLGEVYGKDSEIYEAALPDTSVWIGEQLLENSSISHYYQHPSFDRHPVVGVTHAQVVKYCKWRTDRVAENILIQKGILDPEEMSAQTDPFSLATHSDHSNDIYLPIFRLPTEDEWEQIASGGLDPSNYPNGIDAQQIKKKQQNQSLYNVVIPESYSASTPMKDVKITAPTLSYLPNNYKIYNAIGNVAEMVEEQGVCKGGSFIHYIDECSIENKIIYAKPEKWLGFRCVAYYKIPTKAG